MLFPAAAVWKPLCVAAQSTSFLLLSIFRLHGCHFSRWGSRVGGLLISETSSISRSTTVTKRGRDERPTEPWRSPPNRQRRSAFKKARLLWQKEKYRNPLLSSTYRVLLSSSLHRTTTVAVQSHRRLAHRTWEWYMYDAHLQRTACLWVKRHNHWFSREKRKVVFQGWLYLKLKC